jgi:hypothetical protein
LGTLAHPASARTKLTRSAGEASPPANRIIVRNFINPETDPTVAWLAFEILLGLAAFGLLIWWTLPRGKRDDTRGPPRQ